MLHPNGYVAQGDSVHYAREAERAAKRLLEAKKAKVVGLRQALDRAEAEMRQAEQGLRIYVELSEYDRDEVFEMEPFNAK